MTAAPIRLHHTALRVPLSTGIDLHVVARMSVPSVRLGTDRIDEAILLLHGYSDSWHSFEEMLERLPSGAHDVPVLAPDLRGHGRSSLAPSGDYSQHALATDVVALMDALRIRRALLVGHSGGGLIAHKVAADHPERVWGLVLIATAATMAGLPITAALKADVDTFDDTTPAPVGFVADFQASTFFTPPAPHVLYRYVAESLRLRGHVWKATLDGMSRENHRDRLPHLAAPTLILWGERDEVFSHADQDDLHALIPNATLVTYPDAGHALNVERAAEVATAVERFVQARLTRPQALDA